MWPWLTRLVAWGTRLLGGWLPIGTKPVGEWLGKILWATGIVAAVLLVYHKLTQPTSVSNTPQRAEKIINNYHQPKSGLGCSSAKVFQYYGQEKPRAPENMD